MKHPAILLAVGLILLTLSLVAYRVVKLDYPVMPEVTGETWQLGMEMVVEARQKPFLVTAGLPSDAAGRRVIEEKVSSGSLNFSLLQRGENRLGIWESNGGREPAEQVISYSATVIVRERPGILRATAPAPEFPEEITAEERIRLVDLLTEWKGLSQETRLTEVLKTFLGDPGSAVLPAAKREWWTQFQREKGRTRAIVAIMAAGGIAARPVEGLILMDGIFPLADHWLELWNGRKWISVNSQTGESLNDTTKLLPLTKGGQQAASVIGAEITDIRWSLSRNVISQWRLHFEGIRTSTAFLDRWSLFRLPPEFQGTFRILLLVPIGALLICILRNIVGFPTFGIFMPVLMAISFRMTGLFYGLAIFAGVLILGYWARRFMDRLHLLLVPRMSALLTFVILCFAVVAMEGNKLGVRSFMAVGLLPFVILTMIIERFFGIVEEHGPGEAFLTSAGSAAVAIITYAIISWESLQLTFFMYPELLLAVAGVQIMIGRYTGYRLSEFIRFRSFGATP